MATGFTQRFRGKVTVAQGAWWIGGTAVTPSGADFNSIYGAAAIAVASTVTLAIANSGVTGLSSVGANAYVLAAPVAGVRKTIYSVALGDGARTVSSTAAGATFGSSANIITFSTTALSQTVNLIGLSSVQWAVQSLHGTPVLTTA